MTGLTHPASEAIALIPDTDGPYLSLVGLADAYRSGDLRPTAVVRAHLDRIAARDPMLGAFQAVYAEDAMRLAEAADALFAAGTDLGPFQGIPFALKDICDVAGRITTGGSKAMETRISPATGTLATRLFTAGGIMLGKTKTVECAFGGWGTNRHMGTPRNPWDRETHRVPGGSSSGTGVAVAADLAVCGVGTDTGGSVRLPAAFCGIVGLKLTEGRLPTDGILPLAATLDTPGPLARSVIDALTMFLVMDGQPGHAIARDLANRTGAFAALDQGVRGLRLGVLDEEERTHCAPGVLACYDAALEDLAGLGAELRPVALGRSLADLTGDCGRLIAAEAWFNHRALFGDPALPLDPDLRTRMLQGRDISAADYQQMRVDRHTDRAAYLEATRGLDALLTPTVRDVAPPLASVDQDEPPGHFARFVNWLGLCALTVPSGLTQGLPTGLQIVARPDDEGMALRIGASFERAHGPFPAPPPG
ncbi:amidase [Sulfitobacter sp. D35]|uniref:amidase n=1 Tax=Sulfitobacter sp. D35 TaxID=3083252 RepID=UPI00296EB09F|nr:amidase [Sulfitobacter sp. D35]MDW4499378.1 amidase [Sulfitobacter sp. D35]